MEKIPPGDIHHRYRRFIEQIDNLPSLPAIVSRLITVVNSPESSADDAARLIGKDPALTTKMLRLANSAFYGMPRSISSVTSAVVILGFNTIRSLALSATIMKLFSSTSTASIDKNSFWKHSIVCAMAAKTIARQFLHIRTMDPESAFCAGLLHDVGKLIFSEFAQNDYIDVCTYARSKHLPLLDAENALLGINHADIGKIIADKWALPLDLEYALVYHHDPSGAKSLTDLVTTVHIADHMTHEAGVKTWDNESVTAEWPLARNTLAIDDAAYSTIMQILIDCIDKSNEFIDILK